MGAINNLIISALTAVCVSLLMQTDVTSKTSSPSPNLLLVDISPESINTIVTSVVSGVDNDQATIVNLLDANLARQNRFESNQPMIGQVITLTLTGIAAECTQNGYIAFNGLNDTNVIDGPYFCNLSRSDFWVMDDPPNNASDLNRNFFSQLMLACSGSPSPLPIVVGCRNCKANGAMTYGPFSVGPYCAGESPSPDPTALWIYMVNTSNNIISCLTNVSQLSRPVCVFLNQADGSQE